MKLYFMAWFMLFQLMLTYESRSALDCSCQNPISMTLMKWIGNHWMSFILTYGVHEFMLDNSNPNTTISKRNFLSAANPANAATAPLPLVNVNVVPLICPWNEPGMTLCNPKKCSVNVEIAANKVYLTQVSSLYFSMAARMIERCWELK